MISAALGDLRRPDEEEEEEARRRASAATERRDDDDDDDDDVESSSRIDRWALPLASLFPPCCLRAKLGTAIATKRNRESSVQRCVCYWPPAAAADPSLIKN